MDQANELTLEQEFNLKNFSDQVQIMSLEQAKEFLLFQHKQMMIQEKTYQQLLKHEWKIDADAASL